MRAGDHTCEAVVTAFCVRAAEVQPALNCATEFCFVEALEEARGVDKRRTAARASGKKAADEGKKAADDEPMLLGLPISLKDLINQKGYDTTCGCAAFACAPYDDDGAYLKMVRAQGAIPFVRSNVPQLMMFPETSNNVFGRSRNPHNLERTVGGSSGGEGGLIAARASPLGIGTDIGGSIRIPAHFCGIAGMKPTAQRFSGIGLRVARFDGKNGQTVIPSTSGPMAHCVDDLALFMQAVVGDGNKATRACQHPHAPRVHNAARRRALAAPSRPRW